MTLTQLATAARQYGEPGICAGALIVCAAFLFIAIVAHLGGVS